MGNIDLNFLAIQTVVVFDEPFHQKGDCSNNQQPSVFRQKGDGLPHSFENEDNGRADESGKIGRCFFANPLQNFPYAFAKCLLSPL